MCKELKTLKRVNNLIHVQINWRDTFEKKKYKQPNTYEMFNTLSHKGNASQDTTDFIWPQLEWWSSRKQKITNVGKDVGEKQHLM
jgi:hypothetical protein